MTERWIEALVRELAAMDCEAFLHVPFKYWAAYACTGRAGILVAADAAWWLRTYADRYDTQEAKEAFRRSDVALIEWSDRTWRSIRDTVA